MIKHDGHFRTPRKCTKHEPQASAFYISQVFSNVQSVLTQCNTKLRLLHVLYDVGVTGWRTMKGAFSMFYTVIKHGLLTNQSMCQVLSIIKYMITNFDDNDLLPNYWKGHLLVVYVEWMNQRALSKMSLVMLLWSSDARMEMKNFHTLPLTLSSPLLWVSQTRRVMRTFSHALGSSSLD